MDAFGGSRVGACVHAQPFARARRRRDAAAIVIYAAVCVRAATVRVMVVGHLAWKVDE